MITHYLLAFYTVCIGKKVSLSRIKKYCSEFGVKRLIPKRKMDSVYKPGMSRSAALKAIKETNISRQTVYNFYREHNINPETGYKNEN